MNRKLKADANAVLGSAGPRTSVAFVGIIAFIVLWSLTSGLHLVNSLLLPTPWRVIQSAGDIGWKLAGDIGATVARILVGYIVGMLAGAALGIFMQYNRIAYQILDGIIETFRPVPPVAVIPFFVLLFGFSETGKVLVTVIGVGLMGTVTTVEAIERVSSAIVRWGLVVGLTRWQLFRFIILRAAWPEMRAGMRLAMALAVTLVVVAEFMGATFGLGYLISVSRTTLTTPTLFLAVIILGWIGWGFDRILRLIFAKTAAWDIRAKGATR